MHGGGEDPAAQLQAAQQLAWQRYGPADMDHLHELQQFDLAEEDQQPCNGG